MFGLPKSTEMSRQLPKKAVYEKFNMNTAAKEKFDADISRITIVSEISTATTSIAKGKNVSAIYILLVSLKNKNFNERIITSLSNLIGQKILFVLEYNGEQKLAVCHSSFISGEWKKSDELNITLKGLDFDAVWENIIKDIGGIVLSDGNTLEEQIVVNEEAEKLKKEIARLERLARAEKQPKKKFELVQEIKKLRG